MKRIKLILAVFGISAAIGALPAIDASASALAQGNTVSGFVWGIERQPVADVNVELLNDLYQTIQRTKTSQSGQYQFYTIPGGRLWIRVLPHGTDYERPADAPIEIENFTRDGGTRRSGFKNERMDFHLKLRKGAVPPETAAIFVQEVPPEARQLYDQAISDLGTGREKEGLEKLRSSLETFPKYFHALERLGTEYIRLRHFEAAEILLAIAVDVNARSFKCWYGLAYSRYSQKKYAEALAASQMAAGINPKSPDNTFLSGVLFRYVKKYAEAEKALLEARDGSGDTLPLVHWELALLYGNNLKRYSDAASELRLFLKAQPDAKDAEMIKKLIADFEAKAGKKETS